MTQPSPFHPRTELLCESYEWRDLPIKQVIVSTKLPADDVDRIRETLLALGNSDAGRKALAPSGYKGFQAPDPAVDDGVDRLAGAVDRQGSSE